MLAMAPPSEGAQRPSTLPGLWRYPTNRDAANKGPAAYMEGRRSDDGAEGLWRVHDKLYDFSKFMERHPGGKEWLKLTEGTDITEAFESHHISPMPSRMLKRFEVRPASAPRNSPYTFHPDGFYATLRRRVFAEMPEGSMRGASVQSRLLADTLAFSLTMTCILTASYQSTILAVLAGLLLSCLTVTAHNFIHLKDGWRRFYFDLSLMSNTDWRISHVLSHHLYPNSLHDLELSIVEPLLDWLPRRDKSLITRYFTWPFSFVVYAFIFPFEMGRRLMTRGAERTDLIPLIIPAIMLYFAPPGFVVDTLLLWVTFLFSGSSIFGFLGFNAAHHHPEIFHDGDSPRQDRDWGLSQIDTVRDRDDISGVKGSVGVSKAGEPCVKIDSSRSSDFWTFIKVMSNFGHHTLHHLFPTIDHARLPELYPILEQTLSEFRVPYRTHSFKQLVVGQFQQLANNKPNPEPPGYLKSIDINGNQQSSKSKR